MRVQEAKEAMRKRLKVRQITTGIEGRIVEHYRRNVFLIECSGIRSKTNAGDLTIARRKKSDGKKK